MTFLFDEGHPLFRLYRQQLRSKQATPILAGYTPPSYPGDMTVPSTRLLRNEWKKFATYYLTAFCPWNVETGIIPYTFDFRGFSDFVQTMATRPFFLIEQTLYRQWQQDLHFLIEREFFLWNPQFEYFD